MHLVLLWRETMDQRDRDCVAITHKEGLFLRLDFVDGAMVIFKEKGVSRIRVINDFSLWEYSNFRIRLIDDDSLTQDSRRLTMREGIEAEAILRYCRRHGAFVFARVARFLRSAFPECHNLLPK